jgi:hypothetical protein
MNCGEAMDKYFESLGEEPCSPLSRLNLAIHLFLCPRCAQEIKKLEEARELLKAGFLPPPPRLEDTILARIFEEIPEAAEEHYEIPAGVSFRGWVIIGIIVLFSLATAFFGMDFEEVAASEGSSFLLPMGLTIGAVVTGYGALFIGSHLKELSERFRLR